MFDIMDLILAWMFGMLTAIFMAFFILWVGPWLCGWRNITYSKYWKNADRFEKIKQEAELYGAMARF